MNKFIKDPAFHFLLISIGLFALFFLAPKEPTPTVAQSNFEITVTESDARNLTQLFKATWQRQPTEDELQTLVDSKVRDEIIVREARALGLDQADSAINTRLVQKMKFLTDSVAQSITPSGDELQAYFEENQQRFEVGGKVSFVQVYLGSQATQETVDETLSALRSGTSPRELGVPTMLPSEISTSQQRQVDGQFGSGFFNSIEQGALNEWLGPIQSGLGYHLVIVTRKSGAQVPQLEDIRENVLSDWRREMATEFYEAQFDGFKEQYTISIPTGVQIRGVLTP